MEEISSMKRQTAAIRSQAQNLQQTMPDYDAKIHEVDTKRAALLGEYIKAIKSDPDAYDWSKEETLDEVVWEESYIDHFACEKSIKTLTQKQIYACQKEPKLTKKQVEIVEAFEEKATELGVLTEDEKKSRLRFKHYRGAYVRELFRLIAKAILIRQKKSRGEIAHWRKMKYEFHETYEKNEHMREIHDLVKKIATA